jgi:iron complex outermembrane recepter protein
MIDQGFRRQHRSRQLRQASMAALIFVQAGAAIAQTAAPPSGATTAASEAAVADIVVTGSRITRKGFEAPTPTTVIDAQDFTKRAFTNIGQITNAIPAFVAQTTPASTSLVSARAGGNYLNLRGLGDLRTLTLVNGRRVVPSNPEGSVDTNVIPAVLVQRIDVVTGGASAAYGSDAVAGVVNIVLRDRLDGFMGDAQLGISQAGDNETYRGSLAWGTSFADDRGNFIIAAEGERNNGVGLQTNRDWASNNFAPVGLGGVPPTRVVPNAQFALQTLGGLVASGPFAGTDFGPGGVPRPFVRGPGDGFFQQGGSGVGVGDFVSLTVPFDRYSFLAKGDYDLGGVRLFAEGSYAFSAGRANVLPASNFGTLTIQQDNFFLNPGLRSQLQAANVPSFRMGRYSADYGLLTSEVQNRTIRGTLGLDGNFGSKVRWNIYGQYGRNEADTNRGNNAILARLARAVDAVASPGGGPACRVNVDAVSTNDDPACVPVNLFGFGSPSEAAKGYFLGVSQLNSVFEQYVVAGTVNADLFDLNGEAVTLAVGAEYRDERIDQVADPISQANGFAFGNPKSLSGDRNVKEAFAEIAVPLLRDLPVFKAVDLNAAVRRTDYSVGGAVTSWKAGLTWDIIEGVRLRGTRSRDIRAPNLSELFATSNVLFATVNEGSFTGPVEFVTGGNPNLTPESADTWAAGVVLNPIDGLRASIDYYDIKINDAIATLTAQQIIDRCRLGNQDLCDLIVRDPSGRPTRVNAAQVNVNRIATRGVDFELAYTLPLSRISSGSGAMLNLRALATYVDRLATTNGAITIDRAGEVGPNNNGVPHWRFNIAATYEDGPLTVFLENRFVGGGRYDNLLGPQQIDLQSIKARNYLNASISYDVIRQEDRSLQLFFNINNILDTDPPIAPSNFIAPPQTNAILYDVIGRMFNMGVRFRY